MRIGVMGGSFDPIHYGHLVAASEAAHRFDLARVIFCPTGQAWHKSTDRRAPAEVRYLMTVVATAAAPTERTASRMLRSSWRPEPSPTSRSKVRDG